MRVCDTRTQTVNQSSPQRKTFRPALPTRVSRHLIAWRSMANERTAPAAFIITGPGHKTIGGTRHSRRVGGVSGESRWQWLQRGCRLGVCGECVAVSLPCNRMGESWYMEMVVEWRMGDVRKLWQSATATTVATVTDVQSTLGGLLNGNCEICDLQSHLRNLHTHTQFTVCGSCELCAAWLEGVFGAREPFWMVFLHVEYL